MAFRSVRISDGLGVSQWQERPSEMDEEFPHGARDVQERGTEWNR